MNGMTLSSVITMKNVDNNDMLNKTLLRHSKITHRYKKRNHKNCLSAKGLKLLCQAFT